MPDLLRTSSICPPPETVLLESVNRNDSDNITTLVNSNKLLLTHEYPFTSKTILDVACSEDGVEASTVQLLINLGADLEGNEWKPLHLASQNLNTEILETIIKNLKPGLINETVEGNTALLALIKSQTIQENEEKFCRHVELLLKAGINVNSGDGKNLSAIFWAAKNGYKTIIKTILEKSISHIDLDTHRLRNKSARDLICDKKLYDGILPEKVLYQIPKEKIFSLIKLGKEEEIRQYLDNLSLTSPSDFVNSDDGTFTLLQYSCQKGLTRIAKYLVENGAKINKVVKLQDKTPFEISIENGFYEIVKILIDHSDVDITANTVCYLIKHLDNPKFNKIDHEKCCEFILSKLESNRNLINCEDDFKNTPLHYSLRYGDDSTTQKLLSLGASLASKNHFKIMPIEDIKPELLEQHLNNCIKFNPKNNDEKRDFEVVFEYESLLPPKTSEDPENFQDDGLVPETEVIAYMSQAPEFKPLLNHPLIVSFLFMKWHRIRLLFYINLIFYILFVASLFIYIFTKYANFQCSDLCTLSQFSWIILNLTFWILVFREIFQIVVSPGTYFKNFENYVEIVLIVITGLILYINSPTTDTRKQLSSIAILLSAFELVLMVGQHPKLSTNVVMLKTVSVNFFKLLLWYSLLIVAFALSFNILFAKSEIPQTVNSTQEEEQDLFTGPGKSLFKTIVMLTGEFDAGSINFHTYPVTSKLIFSLFVFMITIILLNLLNGLAVSDTQTIKTNAELVGHITRAQHIHYVESMLLGNLLPTKLLKFAQRLCCCFPFEETTFNFLKPLARRICLFKDRHSQLTVLPNDYGKIFCDFDENCKRQKNHFGSCRQVCYNTYLDKETVRRITSIVKMKRDKFGGNFLNNEKLYEEIVEMKAKLESMLGALELRK